jgi:hypothetical protein
MWIAAIAAAVVVAFIVWRLFLAVRGEGPERPIDSGHPHVTDVDPHSEV